MPISTRPLSHALGAEITGVDVGQPLSNADFDLIHRTFLERGILLFRDQKITREQHIAFSRRFGDLDNHGKLGQFTIAYAGCLKSAPARRKPVRLSSRIASTEQARRV